jgi:LysM repeat protein
MNRNVKLLIPFIAIVAVIVYIILSPEDERQASYESPLPELSIDSGSVVKIEIRQPGKSVILENVGGVWSLTYPILFQADPMAVAQLLHGFSKFKVGSLISTNPEKQPMFQVDSSGTGITFTDRNGSATALIIGKMGPSFSEVYFRLPDSKNVYLGDGIDNWTINKNLKDWRNKTIVQTGTEAIRQIVYTVGSRSHTVIKDTSGWIVGGKIVEDSEVKPLLNSIANLHADDFIDSSLEFSQKPIIININAAEDVTLSLYPNLPDSSRYFIKTSKSPQIYMVSKWSVGELLKPLEKSGMIQRPVRQVTEERTEKPVIETAKEVKAPPVKVVEEEKKPVDKPVSKPVSKILSRRRQKEKDTSSAVQQPTATTEKPQEQKPKQAPTIQQPIPDEEGDLIVHTIRRGETMTSVAKKYNVTPEQIIRWNILKSISVKPGQELYIYLKK